MPRPMTIGRAFDDTTPGRDPVLPSPCSSRRRHLTPARRRREILRMGIAVSPRGDSPSIASRNPANGGTRHAIPHHDFNRQAFPPDRHAQLSGADRRAHRGGFCGRAAPDTRLDRGDASTGSTSGRRLSGRASAIVICQKGMKLSQGVAAWLRHEGVPAEVAGRRRAAGQPPGCPWCRSRCRRATRRGGRSGSHGRGRRSTASPALGSSAASWTRTPCSCSSRRRRCWASPNASAATPFDIEGRRVLEPPRRAVHVRRHGRGVRPGEPSRSSGSRSIVRGADTARPDLVPEGAGPACRLARAVAHVRRGSRAARGRHAALRRLLPLVPRRHRRDPQLDFAQAAGAESAAPTAGCGHEARSATERAVNRRHGWGRGALSTSPVGMADISSASCGSAFSPGAGRSPRSR